MTRDEIANVAAENMPALRRSLRRYISRFSDDILDDCAQAGMLAVLEDWQKLNARTDSRTSLGSLVFHHMNKAGRRYLYAESKARGAFSLNQKVGDAENAAEVGEFIRDPNAPDPGQLTLARLYAQGMAALSSREAKVLLAIADDVSLEQIGHENGIDVLEVLSIKACASRKLQAAAFSRVITRRTHRPLRSLDMSQFGKPEQPERATKQRGKICQFKSKDAATQPQISLLSFRRLVNS
jgi:DNA-directed RNA polymerase sigma subunit (sigma70/sigma32)